MRWLIRGHVAAATDPSEVTLSIQTVLRLGRAARYSAYGREPGGPFCLHQPLRRPNRPTLRQIQSGVDLLRHERTAGRSVAIMAQPASLATATLYAECLRVADGFNGPFRHPLTRWYVQALKRDGEGGIRRRGLRGDPVARLALIHTTSMDALTAIIETGAVRCAARVAASNRSLRMGAVLFNEPDDFADYVMFGGGVFGETVVNSRRLGWLFRPGKDDYVPGVHLYFDRKQLESHPGATYDGVHAMKVKGEVPLAGNLLAVATADTKAAALCSRLDIPVLRARGDRPEAYVADSNRLFMERFGRPTPRTHPG